MTSQDSSSWDSPEVEQEEERKKHIRHVIRGHRQDLMDQITWSEDVFKCMLSKNLISGKQFQEGVKNKTLSPRVRGMRALFDMEQNITDATFKRFCSFLVDNNLQDLHDKICCTLKVKSEGADEDIQKQAEAMVEEHYGGTAPPGGRRADLVEDISIRLMTERHFSRTDEKTDITDDEQDIQNTYKQVKKALNNLDLRKVSTDETEENEQTDSSVEDVKDRLDNMMIILAKQAEDTNSEVRKQNTRIQTLENTVQNLKTKLGEAQEEINILKNLYQ